MFFLCKYSPEISSLLFFFLLHVLLLMIIKSHVNYEKGRCGMYSLRKLSVQDRMTRKLTNNWVFNNEKKHTMYSAS